jgi:hypothetical protein
MCVCEGGRGPSLVSLCEVARGSVCADSHPRHTPRTQPATHMQHRCTHTLPTHPPGISCRAGARHHHRGVWIQCINHAQPATYIQPRCTNMPPLTPFGYRHQFPFPVCRAERVRDSIIAITKARREMDDEVASGPETEASSASVSDAVDQNIRSQMLSVLSDEPRHCELIGCVWLEMHSAQLRASRVSCM